MPDTQLTKSRVEQLHDQLMLRQQELTDSLDGSSPPAAPVTLDQQSVGRVSRIDAIQQQQMAIANRTQMVQQLSLVAQALQRISKGEYGFCLECGEIINFARLQAQPWVSLCIDCQSQRETG